MTSERFSFNDPLAVLLPPSRLLPTPSFTFPDRLFFIVRFCFRSHPHTPLFLLIFSFNGFFWFFCPFFLSSSQFSSHFSHEDNWWVQLIYVYTQNAFSLFALYAFSLIHPRTTTPQPFSSVYSYTFQRRILRHDKS